MTISLLDAASRHADAHANADGVAATLIAGLTILRETCPSPLRAAVSKPLVALVLQGAKRVAMGSRSFDFGAGDSLLIAADVPTVSQVTAASPARPYYSFVIELDPAVIAGLVVEMGPAPTPLVAGPALRVDPTGAEVADTALRLLRLLDRPAALPLLAQPLVRELHYWLLAGRHGGAIRSLGAAGSHAQRIGRAVALIRSGFARTLRVEQLAEAAGMSLSSFHVHFRGVTSLSPLQFQKQLRLIEARRAMLADGAPIANAAFAVGYESISQFTREYGRMFGQPPARDVRDARARTRAAW
jgi:AraC-like DNA-binding protein